MLEVGGGAERPELIVRFRALERRARMHGQRRETALFQRSRGSLRELLDVRSMQREKIHVAHC